VASGQQWRLRLDEPDDELPAEAHLSKLLEARVGPDSASGRLSQERLEALKALGDVD
jgi:hypothetical protein